jgi:preprotein translocase subunit SecA
MAFNILRKLFGTPNDRQLKRLSRIVDSINDLEPDFKKLTDDELRAKTDEFRSRLAKDESLDDLLPEAFAAVREAAWRTLQMRHFDVQLLGAIVLHQGKIAEMRTGEGKTLAATLTAYLNALSGEGVHIVTVNDYLAGRDAEWMGQVYSFLGMTTGVVVSQQSYEDKKAAYEADITYGTNNEFGFDYLRDNMAFTAAERVQRGRNYAIVDEVDSILIDEARTPLIISGPVDEQPDLYLKINKLIPELTEQEEEDGPGDYTLEEKNKQIYLTDEGHETVERLLGEAGLLTEGQSLYDAANLNLMHHLNAGLRAHLLFKIDVDYIVQDGKIVIVDEFTGRTMPGRRWSEGLHQAVEAKEGVTIRQESQTMASITFQNYFRTYNKLSGMTGTAETEAFELLQTYGLEVVVIPTHHDMIREDMGDLVYLSIDEKYEAIMENVRDCQKRGQPVLVGTASVDVSEQLSSLMSKASIKHSVLNAKQHDKEAQVIAQAGQPGHVTIATNMAGRGTDIVLGGNLTVELADVDASDETQTEKIRTEWQKRHDQVIDAGGLHIVGTERHESRRVDNQLRGRSGRQGDPGSSRFYLSLKDSLMRIFASDRVAGLMQKLGMEKGESIEHPWVSKAIENAQRKVEAHNYNIRKTLLEFDNVANDQRQVVYEQRNELMDIDDVSEIVDAIRRDILGDLISEYMPPGSLDEQWDIPGLEEALENEFALQLPIHEWLEEDHDLHEEPLRERIHERMIAAYREKEEAAGVEVVRHFEKAVMLQVLDTFWKEHLAAMDYLRQGIGLRGYAQKDPKQEFKKEAFAMFTDMLDRIKHEIIGVLSKVQVRAESDVEAVENQRRSRSQMKYQHADPGNPDDKDTPANANRPVTRTGRKVGRNEPCPCGSGKKFKHCHGKLA